MDNKSVGVARIRYDDECYIILNSVVETEMQWTSMYYHKT
jgi:hypothetical protein